MDREFHLGQIAEKSRKSLMRKPTQADAVAHFAAWWDALHAELAECRREQVAGVINHRVSREDVDHAQKMAVWTRYQHDDHVWQQQSDNVAALRTWQQRKPSGDDEHAAKAAYAALPDQVRAKLSTRPRAPDRRDIAIGRPSKFLPPRWPEIRPGVLWTMYLSELLTEFRRIAGAEEIANDDAA